MIFFLTGFSGAGKSRIGKNLAAELSVDFKDLDTIIEEKLGCTIIEFFDQYGEKAFRKIENRSLEELIAGLSANTVVALGGGTICSKPNLKLILRNGICIYLKREAEYFLQNFSQLVQTRPVFSGLSSPDALLSLLEQRRMFYEKSQLETLVNKDFSTKKLANTLKLLTFRTHRL